MRDRKYQMSSLLMTDPDVVVDLLGITTSELCLAFPDKVWRYLKREGGNDDGTAGAVLYEQLQLHLAEGATAAQRSL